MPKVKLMPMTPAEIRDLVERARINQRIARSQSGKAHKGMRYIMRQLARRQCK